MAQKCLNFSTLRQTRKGYDFVLLTSLFLWLNTELISVGFLRSEFLWNWFFWYIFFPSSVAFLFSFFAVYYRFSNEQRIHGIRLVYPKSLILSFPSFGLKLLPLLLSLSYHGGKKKNLIPSCLCCTYYNMFISSL